MNKSIWCGALVIALVAARPSGAHAEELEEYDMCFSMASVALSSIGCGKMEKMFDDTINDMTEKVDRDLLKGMTKKQREKYLDSHGQEWLVALIGMKDEETRSECAPIAQDEGTWYTYKRDDGNNYTEERSVRSKSGLLGELVTPRQQMVCLSWEIPLQAPVERSLSKRIADAFFEYRWSGQIRLDELQIRTE